MRPIKTVDDLLGEIRKRVGEPPRARDYMTKRMAEIWPNIARGRRALPVPAFGSGNSTDQDPARFAPRQFDVLIGINRCASRSAGSFAGGDSGCGQGRISASAVRSSDYGPNGAASGRPGDSLRRRHDRRCGGHGKKPKAGTVRGGINSAALRHNHHQADRYEPDGDRGERLRDGACRSRRMWRP